MKNQLIRKDPVAGKDWKQEEKGAAEDQMVGWHHQLNGHEFEQTQRESDGQGSLVCCSPRDLQEWDMTATEQQQIRLPRTRHHPCLVQHWVPNTYSRAWLRLHTNLSMNWIIDYSYALVLHWEFFIRWNFKGKMKNTWRNRWVQSSICTSLQ